MNETRCLQLATIQRNAAGKALVADIKVKHLDASSVDLLRIVKVRCRRCAPSSVLGCPSVARSAPHAGVLVYPLECSCGTRQHARVLSSQKSSIPTHARSPEDGSSQAALKKQEEAAARKRQEEAAAKKKQDDAARKKQEEAANKRAAEEAAKKQEQEVRGCALLAAALGSAWSPTPAMASPASGDRPDSVCTAPPHLYARCVPCLLPLIAPRPSSRLPE
jgi:hypothetical protein